MRKIEISAYDLAARFVGTKEVKGTTANPQILAMLRLDDSWPKDDAVYWCSAFTNYVAWLLRLPRSKSLLARSWLSVGQVISVGFYAGIEGANILVLGGNQNDSVSIAPYMKSKLLGVRRLA